MSASKKQCIVHAHLAALLFGGTALFAKLILLPAEVITFWRTVVAVLFVVVLCRVRGHSLRLAHRRDMWIQVGIGCILGLHWVTYFASIKLSSVAIGITALYASPVLTVLIEAALHRVWPDVVDLLLGGIVFIGVMCLAPDLSWQNEYTQGVLLGVISAFFLATRQILHTRSRVRHTSGMTLLFYQLLGVGVLFAYSGCHVDFEGLKGNVGYLLILGAIFTALPHFFNLSALRELGARSFLIISSLMVPYSMVFSALLLDEMPDAKILIGCALVMGAATAENFRTASAKV